MIIQEVQFTKTDKQGKESQVKVMLGYCFATEILFNEMAGEEVGTFVKEAISQISEGKMPDRKKSMILIQAAMEAYYESVGKKAPITEKDLKDSHHSDEFGTAIGTILGMYIKMNTSPAGENVEKKNDAKEDSEDPKNA
ncbi:hypothetical protein [uncultured Prevotella sp.]|uniref:hypothetical protein n=1 Tax=uncultured Prevotella sp. TaxID=159272 RepID=UPI002582B6F7|nr:hypothetical protein [uncultured Prevotella sp.]